MIQKTPDPPNPYMNKWVALTSDKKPVVSATDIKKLDNKVKKAGIKDVIYHYVLPYDKSFSPFNGKN